MIDDGYASSIPFRGLSRNKLLAFSEYAHCLTGFLVYEIIYPQQRVRLCRPASFMLPYGYEVTISGRGT